MSVIRTAAAAAAAHVGQNVVNRVNTNAHTHRFIHSLRVPANTHSGGTLAVGAAAAVAAVTASDRMAKCAKHSFNSTVI